MAYKRLAFSPASYGVQGVNAVSRKLSIVIACGGTGGHLFPGIAVAEESRRRGHKVLLLISRKRVDADASAKYGSLDFVSVAAIAKPPTLSFRIIPFLVKLWRTVRQSRRIFKDHQVDVVLGMGGFTSLPPIYAARKMELLTALHDSNALPGKANRLGARWCNRVLLGLEAARGYFESSEVHVTGTPIRSEFCNLPEEKEARVRFGLNPDQPVVLCFGGSQGARFLNTLVVQLAEILGEGVQWLHVAGRQDEERVKGLVGSREGHVVLGFCDDMPAAYAASTLVISRSGGASLSELAALSLPSILVPYPHAADDHQTFNARCFEEAGASVLVPESTMNAADLSGVVGNILGDPSKLESMRQAADSLSTKDAAEKICDTLETVQKAG
ncbi:MAG: undecaprenyldiphospho-muramoylpentapeptide beta-N-acetylglucosaminyltransferase [Verrucomicrobia bacterium]|nr:MAG: undecaprenyldiphospho-muramoylpentapeptide beta-N-acetylglucosaminyltransferase [Verrucomicrobiota bacterium]